MRLVLALLLLGGLRPLAAQSAPALHDLAFMSGCWVGSFSNGGIIEERYTPPSDNILLGTTRYLVRGRTVQFEFTAIGVDAAGAIELRPSPGGRPSPHAFRLTQLLDGAEPLAVFEAPDNDFPKRIVYRRISGTPDTLVARIDNGEGEEGGQEWRMAAADCEVVPGADDAVGRGAGGGTTRPETQ